MNANGFDAKVLGTKPGSASSVKMLRSVIMKGIEALAVEITSSPPSARAS